MPKVSRDGRTYTFTIRRGNRFSSGESVTSASFAPNQPFDMAVNGWLADGAREPLSQVGGATPCQIASRSSSA